MATTCRNCGHASTKAATWLNDGLCDPCRDLFESLDEAIADLTAETDFCDD